MNGIVGKIKINDDEYYEITTAATEAGFCSNQFEPSRKCHSNKMYLDGCGVYNSLEDAQAAAAGLIPEDRHQCDCEECREQD